MKKFISIIAVALALSGNLNAEWPSIATGWSEIQTPSGFSMPASCTTIGMVPFLGSTVALACDAGLTYNAATDTLTVGSGGVSTAGGGAFGAVTSAGSIQAAASGWLWWASGRGVLTSPASATIQLGAPHSATGASVAQTLQTQSNITQSDVAAPAAFTVIGPRGTGTGAAGSIVFQTGVPQAAGATAHVPATALTLTNAGTGGTSAPQALFADGSNVAPAISWATSPTSGFFASGSGSFGYRAGTTDTMRVGALGMTLASNIHYGWSSSTNPGAGADTYLGRGAAATLQLGAANSATPVAQTLQAQGGSGTDIAGASLTIQSGAGTGAGAGSTLTFKTPTAGASGPGAQTQVTRLELAPTLAIFSTTPAGSASDAWSLGTSGRLWQNLYLSRATLGSKSKAITDGSATAFATFTIADGATYGGKVIYSVVATQGTAKQRLDGEARFSATREGSTYTVVVNEIGTQTLAAAAGTLTGAIEISGTAGVVTLSANFNTSLTPDTFVINARFDSPDAGLALTFP